MTAMSADLRHAVRGAFNGLKLCVSALEMPLETSEKLEFLSDVETSAARIERLLAEFEAATPCEEASEVSVGAQVR